MRALSALLVLCLGLVAVVLLAPAAAAATTSGAAVSAGVVGAGALAAGITLRLSARKYSDDGTATSERFKLDTDSEDFADQMQDFAEAKVEEGAAPVRVELASAQADRDAYRDAIVDEILRVQTLANTDSEGTLSADFDADSEREYLNSLPPKTLALHAKKAREKTVSLKAQTSGEQPAAEADDSAYGHVTVA